MLKNTIEEITLAKISLLMMRSGEYTFNVVMGALESLIEHEKKVDMLEVCKRCPEEDCGLTAKEKKKCKEGMIAARISPIQDIIEYLENVEDRISEEVKDVIMDQLPGLIRTKTEEEKILEAMNSPTVVKA